VLRGTNFLKDGLWNENGLFLTSLAQGELFDLKFKKTRRGDRSVRTNRAAGFEVICKSMFTPAQAKLGSSSAKRKLLEKFQEIHECWKT